VKVCCRCRDRGGQGCSLVVHSTINHSLTTTPTMPAQLPPEPNNPPTLVDVVNAIQYSNDVEADNSKH
jgi:hypothetical protein